MARTARSTCPRCLGSPISKVNLLTATRSLVVVTDADRMLTCWSEMERVTSDSSPVRSRASTWIATRNSESSVGDHRTATRRSGSESSRCRRLVQSARCTDTPWPRVTKPVISSPGTGVQQRDSLAQLADDGLGADMALTDGRVQRGQVVEAHLGGDGEQRVAGGHPLQRQALLAHGA